MAKKIRLVDLKNKGLNVDFDDLNREIRDNAVLKTHEKLIQKIDEINITKTEEIKNVSRETNEQYQKVSALIKDLHDSLVQLSAISKGINEGSDQKFAMSIQTMEKAINSMSQAVTEAVKPKKKRIVNLSVPINRNNYGIAESFNITGSIEEK